jgi:hypothetical protein
VAFLNALTGEVPAAARMPAAGYGWNATAPDAYEKAQKAQGKTVAAPVDKTAAAAKDAAPAKAAPAAAKTPDKGAAPAAAKAAPAKK